MKQGPKRPASQAESSYGLSDSENADLVPVSNWAGNVLFGAARTHRPESVDSLRKIVAQSSQIRALGYGHSFSSIADTAGDMVMLDSLPRTLRIDSARSTVTVSSGLSYTELASQLHRRGFALANMASVPQISIAGACGTGTHGSGNELRVLADAVTALQLVVADGTLVELQRDDNRDLFPGSVVALGALGIVTELTLEIEPTYEVAQRVFFGVPLDEIQNEPDRVFRAGYSVSVFTDWRTAEATVWVKRRMDRPTSRWSAGRPAQHPIHPIPGMSPGLCTDQLGVVGPWCERLPHFRAESTLQPGAELQSELFLPRAAAGEAMNALRELGGQIAPALQISEIRTVRADDLWMSPAYGRDTVTFHFTWGRDQATARRAIAAVDERLAEFDARPHWGKLTTLPPTEVLRSYDRSADFEGLIFEYDPTLKFRNDFMKNLFSGFRKR